MPPKVEPPEIVLTYRNVYELLRDGEIHYRPPGAVGYVLSLVEATYQSSDYTLDEEFRQAAQAERRKYHRALKASQREFDRQLTPNERELRRMT